jgi:hypothetical protein
VDSDDSQKNLALSRNHAVVSANVSDSKISFENNFLQIISENLPAATTIEEIQKRTEIFLEIRKKFEMQEIERKLKFIEIEKVKSEFLFSKIQKGVTISVGIALTIASFFIFPTNGLLGGALFGTGLGALGITVVLPKFFAK